MVSPVRLLSMALLAGSLSSLLAAQQPARTDPPEGFAEAIDVRVVNVEAVVTDAKGERVRGLGAADFVLRVDGREVPIEYFSEVAAGRPAAGAGGGAGAAPPPGTAEAVGRSFLVFVDDSFAIAAQRNAALDGLAAELPRLRAADRMAVLAFDGRRIDVLSGWTGDAVALGAALRQARARPTNGGQRIAQNRDMDVDLDLAATAGPEVGGDYAMTYLVQRVSPEARTQLGRTAPAIAAALRAFPAPPGRKVMFLVSGGWQVGVAPQLYGPVLAAADRLGYTLYPVDAANPTPEALRALGALAAYTGGQAFAATPGSSAFRQLVADTDAYYWLGFTPAWKADDRRHNVTLTARRPGLTVRARNGYTDLSRKVDTALRAEGVLLFGGQGQERRLVVELGRPRPVRRGEVEVPVTLGVPVEALLLTPATPPEQGYVAEVPLAVAAVDAQGGRADLPGARLRVTLKERPGRGGYARFRTALKLRQGGQRIVFAVDDPLDGTVLWGEAKVAP